MREETIDRTAASRALAKVIAYRACKKDDMADEWLRDLIVLIRRPEKNAPGQTEGARLRIVRG